MTNYRTIVYVLILSVLLVFGCQPEVAEKYKRPDWLIGKVYTQLKEIPDASIFTRCIELIGYDTIIDVSGTFTILAPTDDALNDWLIRNGYGSAEEVPLAELDPLVKFHILQGPWTKLQLTTLDVYGWIDTLDVTNDQPGGYKRETILREEDKQYTVSMDRDQAVIDESGTIGFPRKVITDSRKFAPFFFKAFLDIYDLTSSDYEFYFNRPWESNEDIYFGNGKILGEQIPAENGFIFLIDEVVEPMKNGYQLLANPGNEYSYSKFLDLVNNFPEFEFNEERTNEQPGANLGLQVDSLFDISYPELDFDISSERTKSPTRIAGLPENVSIRYHHGMLAPTDEAFDQLINDFISIPFGWGSIEDAPLHIKRIIANSHLSTNAVYPSDMTKGFYNGEKDYIFIDEGDVVHEEYGSNCTFIGLSKPVVPRVFSSVAGPIYLQRGFSTTMYAIEASGLLPALKRENRDYMLFFEDDNSLSEDSSLRYDLYNDRFTNFLIEGSTFKESTLKQKDLRNLILNHIGVYQPLGVARKEFIPNLAGNFLIVNNETGVVSGTAPTTVGYSGSVQAPNYPALINSDTDNGSAYLIDNWFSFGGSPLYNTIQVNYPHFYNLLDKAGLVQKNLYRFTFTSDSEFYTVLVPTDSAMQANNIGSLPKADLQQFLKLHFIQGHLIFTDGRKNSGYYETLRKDESSTEYTTFYTRIYIDPHTDVIEVRASDGSIYAGINESESANVMAGMMVTEDEDLLINNFLINGVIHEMENVLDVNELDRN